MPLIYFLALTVGGGLLIGFLTRPGKWYVSLAKPWFTPPNNVFAPVWTLLYIMIAIAGERTFMRDPVGAPMTVWTVALALNFAWSPIFFRLHRPLAALFVILGLLGTIVAFIVLSWQPDTPSALLFVPYAAWVLFAVTLNGAIWRLNS
jgi:benzodiazapine receptor